MHSEIPTCSTTICIFTLLCWNYYVLFLTNILRFLAMWYHFFQTDFGHFLYFSIAQTHLKPKFDLWHLGPMWCIFNPQTHIYLLFNISISGMIWNNSFKNALVQLHVVWQNNYWNKAQCDVMVCRNQTVNWRCAQSSNWQQVKTFQ